MNRETARRMLLIVSSAQVILGGYVCVAKALGIDPGVSWLGAIAGLGGGLALVALARSVHTDAIRNTK